MIVASTAGAPIAAIATHSIEKLYDTHDILPHCGGKLSRVQYLHAIRRLEVMDCTHA
jgi:hypothetical protein